MLVVVTVVGRPPYRPKLRGGSTHPRHDKLENAAGLERAVGKVAMKSRREGKHPHAVGQQQNTTQLKPVKNIPIHARCRKTTGEDANMIVLILEGVLK